MTALLPRLQFPDTLLKQAGEVWFEHSDESLFIVKVEPNRFVFKRHRQFNELKAKRLPGSPDQMLTATPVTSAQAVKAWERASRRSAALLLAVRRKRLAT